MLRHLAEAVKYRNFIEDGAQLASVDLSVIFGIGSRESHWGLALKPKGPTGTGDHAPRKWPTKFRTGTLPPDGGGFGRGLMQIDFDAHPFARTKDEWKDPLKNITYGCSVLRDSINFLRKQQKSLTITDEMVFAGGIAAYNTGPGNVLRSIQAGDPIDQRTSHHNYSRDVLARAEWFKSVGGWEAL